MALSNKDLDLVLPRLYTQEHEPDPIAQVRFHDSLGSWSWYAIEFDGEDLFFGLVLGFERELGYFTLSEFREVNRAAGFDRIERDAHFQPTRLSLIQRA